MSPAPPASAIGTVYRRFPDKESLVSELFRDRIDALVTVAEEACAAADPWHGLVASWSSSPAPWPATRACAS